MRFTGADQSCGYALDARRGTFADTGLQALGPFGAPDGLVANEVLVGSYDGVEIPLSIVYPATARMDGSDPTPPYGCGFQPKQ